MPTLILILGLYGLSLFAPTGVGPSLHHTADLMQESPMQGAWQLTHENSQAIGTRESVAIFSDHYFMFGSYHDDGRFIGAGGGTYTLDEDQLTLTFDFFTDNPSLVRVPQTFQLDLNGDQLVLSGTLSEQDFSQQWSQLKAEETPLSSAWRFAARIDEEGNMGERRTPGPRQTIKILGGGRFQWAAFNYETKEFMGTGGGTYQAKEGTYTETIEFFSRDNSRVGQSLSFQFNRQGDDWYHNGKSSQGKPLHEVWTLVK